MCCTEALEAGICKRHGSDNRSNTVYAGSVGYKIAVAGSIRYGYSDRRNAIGVGHGAGNIGKFFARTAAAAIVGNSCGCDRISFCCCYRCITLGNRTHGNYRGNIIEYIHNQLVCFRTICIGNDQGHGEWSIQGPRVYGKVLIVGRTW